LSSLRKSPSVLTEKLPITYNFNISQDIPKHFIREIENALTEWEKATEYQIVFNETNEKPNIVFNFNSNNPADEDDKKYIVAYTIPNVENNDLINMEVIFYLKNPQGKYYDNNQVYNTALHEIAHALGFMGHSNDKKNIMYLTKDSKDLLVNKREELTLADINTIKLLYKLKPEITNSKELAGEYIPLIALGSNKEVSTAKIREAKNYIKTAPNLPNGYMDLAEGFVAIKRYADAIRSLEKALQMADTSEFKRMIYYNLAVAYFYIDNLELANDYLKKSIELDSSDEQKCLQAEIYLKQNKKDLAINEYNKLIKKNPDNIDYILSLTNIYVIERNFLKARKILKDFIKTNPEFKNDARLKSYGILSFFL